MHTVRVCDVRGGIVFRGAGSKNRGVDWLVRNRKKASAVGSTSTEGKRWVSVVTYFSVMILFMKSPVWINIQSIS